MLSLALRRSPCLVRCGHIQASHTSLLAQKTSRVFRRYSVKGLYLLIPVTYCPFLSRKVSNLHDGDLA